MILTELHLIVTVHVHGNWYDYLFRARRRYVHAKYALSNPVFTHPEQQEPPSQFPRNRQRYEQSALSHGLLLACGASC